ncbi:hypothetical protein Y032_0068g259 [Ancylostoma ceylanicum]|uniref:CCHC-type domain-containing protein n=1 Tax=Ancylostoma ceylanicum TaxID=53326 RepID=A0A016TZ48_9BILA|nr:hypothetical protein Y032_0068g259 [Ancylostoma ceylanicum]
MKCYNCNKLGHLRRDCRNRKVAEKTAEKDEHSQGSSGTAKMFTASLSKWICGSVGKVKGHDELVGRQTVTNVRLLGLTRKALLDTGSQISIIPLGMFQASLATGFNLDTDVEEISINHRNPVYDASGNKMSFKGAVRLTLQLENGVKRRIALFVMAGGDGMVVLGTNALAKLGIGPTSTSGVLMTAEKAINEAAGKTSTTVRQTQRRRRWKQQSDVAQPPNSSSLAGAKLIRVGEGVGKHGKSHAAVKLSQGRRRRKQREKAAPVSATVLPTNRMSVPAAGTACSKCRRFPEMRMGEVNASGKLSVTKSSAGASLLRAGEVDKGSEIMQPRKSRANRGRPRRAPQKKRGQSDRILCSRTLLVTTEQLRLRCARDISGQMDEVRDEERRHLFVQVNNETTATSRLMSPSKDATRRPRREDARGSLQPRGTADSTPPQENTQPLNGRRQTHWQGPRRRKQLHEATTAPKSN